MLLLLAVVDASSSPFFLFSGGVSIFDETHKSCCGSCYYSVCARGTSLLHWCQSVRFDASGFVSDVLQSRGSRALPFVFFLAKLLLRTFGVPAQPNFCRGRCGRLFFDFPVCNSVVHVFCLEIVLLTHFWKFMAIGAQALSVSVFCLVYTFHGGGCIRRRC